MSTSPRMSWLFVLFALTLVGCGPDAHGGDDDDDDDSTQDPDGGPSDCTNPTPELCTDGIDQDCDNLIDCDDADCSDAPACSSENCGRLEEVTGLLTLPDGNCDEDEVVPCEGYQNAITFTGFTAGQTLSDISALLGICVNMEHSWMRDLVIYAECPNGTRVMLSDFEGRTGGQVYLGQPNDTDAGGNPVPGIGWDYCWTPTATNAPWIPYANQNLPGTLPSGDYQSSEPLDAFVGCPLNGDWTIRVEDRWPIDNGFIFEWSVHFDPAIVEDCANWPE